MWVSYRELGKILNGKTSDKWIFFPQNLRFSNKQALISHNEHGCFCLAQTVFLFGFFILAHYISCYSAFFVDLGSKYMWIYLCSCIYKRKTELCSLHLWMQRHYVRKILKHNIILYLNSKEMLYVQIY